MSEKFTNQFGATATRYTPPSCICCEVMGVFFTEDVTGFGYCFQCFNECGDTCRFLQEVLS